MVKTVNDFKDYLKTNRDNLDKNKFKWLTKEQNKTLYNEWIQTWSIPKSYFNTNKTTSPAVESNKQNINVDTTSSLWEVSKTNPWVSKVSSTIDAFENKQIESATKSWEELIKWAEAQKDLISKTNQWARDRYESQQKQLDENKKRAEQSDEDRRKQASKIVQRQEWIASRQANIAAARAAQWWVQLSDSDMEDIKNDIISKYWENVASAEQFALQTNMSLDQALTQLDSNIFKDKQAIDNFVNQLDEKEVAPVLSALAEASKWNAQAINDAKNFFNNIITKKADEEAWRMLENERTEDWQRQWTWMNQRQKGDWLFSKLWENSWVLDEYRENPAKYQNMSATEALATLQKIAVQRGELWGNAWLQVYIQLKSQAKAAWQPFSEIPAYEKLLSQWDAALRQTDATAESKTSKRDETNLQSTEKVNTYWLTDKTRNTLDTALWRADKNKIKQSIDKLLSDWRLNKTSYDKIINYINSK